MHRSHTVQRQQVVHVREHTFLHFTTVPSIQDNLDLFSQVEYNCSFRVQAQFFVVFNFSFRSVHDNEIRFTEVSQFFSCRTDEHVCYEVSLPCYFHDEAQFQARVFVSSAESVNNEQSFVRKFFSCQIFHSCPTFSVNWFVVVFVFFRSPPYCIFAGFVFYEEFIFRRTSCINASHYVYSAHVSYLAFFKTFQTWFCFFSEQNVIRRIVHNLGHTCDTVLA